MTAEWGRILTHDNFLKREFSLVGWYCMCCSGETIAHLLLHWNIAFGLWSRALGAFGVQWVLAGIVSDLLFSSRNLLGKHLSDIWNLVQLCLMWLLWRGHNCRTFGDIEHCMTELEATVFLVLFLSGIVCGLHAKHFYFRLCFLSLHLYINSCRSFRLYPVYHHEHYLIKFSIKYSCI